LADAPHCAISPSTENSAHGSGQELSNLDDVRHSYGTGPVSCPQAAQRAKQTTAKASKGKAIPQSSGGTTHEHRNRHHLPQPTVSPFIQNLQQQQPQKPQTSKEAIAANVKALIEQLEEGHSEGLTAYLMAMGRFHNYSFGNILEIARQKPSATRVAGMYAWNQLGSRSSHPGQQGSQENEGIAHSCRLP
jgi:hypothetical protein